MWLLWLLWLFGRLVVCSFGRCLVVCSFARLLVWLFGFMFVFVFVFVFVLFVLCVWLVGRLFVWWWRVVLVVVQTIESARVSVQACTYRAVNSKGSTGNQCHHLVEGIDATPCGDKVVHPPHPDPGTILGDAWLLERDPGTLGRATNLRNHPGLMRD